MNREIKQAKSATTRPSVSVPKIVSDNIQHLIERQRERERNLGWFHRAADVATRVAGSPAFLLVHLIWFVGWILLNTGVFHFVKSFDPYPFGFLTFVVSLEAIGLSVMVLMVQNQIQVDADRRAELDLHVNLLAETESTLILKKLCRIENHFNIEVSNDERARVEELLTDTNPVDIEYTIEEIS